MLIEVVKAYTSQSVAVVHGKFEDGPAALLAKAFGIKISGLYEHLGFNPQYTGPSFIGREGGYWVEYVPVGFSDRSGRAVLTHFLRHRTKKRISPISKNRPASSLATSAAGEEAGVSFAGGAANG